MDSAVGVIHGRGVPGPGGGRPGEAAAGDVDAEVLAALDGDVAQAAHVDVGFVGLPSTC